MRCLAGATGLSECRPRKTLGRAQSGDAYEYWTPARLMSAQALPAPFRVVSDAQLSDISSEAEPISDPPMFTPGWDPDSKTPQPNPGDVYTLNFSTTTSDHTTQTFGMAPSNPKDGPYARFQRWTMHGRYLMAKPYSRSPRRSGTRSIRVAEGRSRNTSAAIWRAQMEVVGLSTGVIRRRSIRIPMAWGRPIRVTRPQALGSMGSRATRDAEPTATDRRAQPAASSGRRWVHPCSGAPNLTSTMLWMFLVFVGTINNLGFG